MNKESVNAATDDVLKEFGLCAMGDIIALRAVCFTSTDTSTERIDELKTIIRSNNRLTNKNEKKRSVTFGWMHYDSKLKRYKAVRAKSGGGSRAAKLSESSTKEDCLGLLREIFCSDTRYFEKNFGPISLLKFELGSFSEHLMPDEFVLGDYIAENRLTKVRLYLMTKQIRFFDYDYNDNSDDEDFVDTIAPYIPSKKQSATLTNNNQASSSGYIDGNASDGDADFDINPFNPLSQSSVMENPTNSIFKTHEDISVPPEMEDSKLIGTSIERRNLADEREHAYNESLRIDKAKEEQCMKKHEKEIHAAQLQDHRRSRVQPEPSLYEDHVIISIRHPDLGTVRRIFKVDETMNIVYDWIGYLATLPMYFRLSLPNDANFIKPVQSVNQYSKIVLNLSESETPVCLEDDGEVSWSGFS